MIEYVTAKTVRDIEQILELQQDNLPQNLNKEQIASQGFVTVHHSFDILQKMNSIEQSIIAKENDKVVGYLLAMTRESRNGIPVLIPMFKVFDNVTYKNKKIAAYNYIVVGQVCIAEGYRGKGILDDCYSAYKNHFKKKYDFAITEIHKKNLRSLKAHDRIGFENIHSYTDPNGDQWEVVIWDWKKEI
jgi:L-amino acid N-acyltransferase YncA